MISYLKIYGPPLYDAIKELEKIAVDMPEVCIMDTILDARYPDVESAGIQDYFSGFAEITIERCGKIISKSGEKLGEYDFFFEWFKDPNMDELETLIKKIDEALKPLGCKYTITTKK